MVFIYFYFLQCSVCAQHCFRGMGGRQSQFAGGTAELQALNKVMVWNGPNDQECTHLLAMLALGL